MEREREVNERGHYSYVVIYVDDILCVHEYPKRIMYKFGSVYRLKDGSVEKPKGTLG